MASTIGHWLEVKPQNDLECKGVLSVSVQFDGEGRMTLSIHGTDGRRSVATLPSALTSTVSNFIRDYGPCRFGPDE